MKKQAILLLGAITAWLSGCTAFDQLACAPNCHVQTGNSSSLVAFLYPDGKTLPADNAIPVLHVPLRVGLAFLPASAARGAPVVDAAHRDELLERIRKRFADRKFVSEIVLIPDYYLSNSKGYEGLQGVQRLYNVDLMALVSYDQVTHLDDNKLSLGYLTIVGAYVLKGSSHDINTLVDLAVVDPATRSLVLRAGGTDTRQGRSTLIDQARDVRNADVSSFSAATDQMVTNFDTALTRFEADVHAGKANVSVVSRNGATGGGGGGAMDWASLAALLMFAWGRVRRVQQERPRALLATSTSGGKR